MPTIERVFSGNERQDNLNMWGKLFIDKTGQGQNGWLVDSWSTGGAPYWQPRMNWVTMNDRKIHLVQMNVGMHNSEMNIYTADAEIEPERATFIRATIAKWELEWLDQESSALR